jgi:hypothetical protein
MLKNAEPVFLYFGYALQLEQDISQRRVHPKYQS